MDAVRIHNLISRLAECTATPGQGVTRFSYSPQDRLARNIVEGELAALDLPSWTDWAGNLHARLPGTDPSLPPLVVGSHLDSVRHGGRYDGAVGVVGALAVLERLRASTPPPARSVRFVAFAEEEGSNFNLPLLGSKALIGALKPADLEGLRNAAGVGAAEAMAAFGLAESPEPDWLAGPEPGFMLELHVEQSAVLHNAGLRAGAVERIAADRALTVRLKGRAGHTGATPMPGRRDALAGAAEIILACEGLANGPEGLGCVMTVGCLRCAPNSFNCIPEETVLTIDMRHPVEDALDAAQRAIERRIAETAAARTLEYDIDAQRTPGVALSPRLVGMIRETARAMDLECPPVVSWAMHDASSLALRMEAGMIFIPSRDGLSHNPGEYTEPGDIQLGVDLLCRTAAGIAGNTAL